MFIELNLGIRLVLLVVLILLTFWATTRGLQNGILLLLVTALFPLEAAMLVRGGMISGGIGLPNLTLTRIVWPLVVAVFVLHWRRGKIDRYGFDLMEYSMLALVAIILISMYVHGTYNTDKWGVGGKRLQLDSLLSGFVVPFICYFIARRGAFTKAQVKSLLVGVGAITLYLGITGVGEAWDESWLVFPKYILNPNVGIHFGHVRGPFVQASWNGLAMVMGLPIFLWLFFRTRDANRWLWLLGIAVVGMALPYVFQRAVWLGAIAALGITLLAWPKRGPLLMGGLILFVLVGGLLLPELLERRIEAKLARYDNIEFRLLLLEKTWEMIRDNPVTGVGWSRFLEEIDTYGLNPLQYHPHNTPFILFAELGLLGFLPYLSIFSLLLFKSAKAYWQLPWSRVMIGGLWGITAAYVIMLMSVQMTITVYANVLFFTLWGVLLGTIRNQRILPQERYRPYPRVISFV